MTDIFDQATEREERDRELAIAAARASAPALPCVGSCYNCGEATAPYARFCDADCCRDYERRIRAERFK